MRAYLDSCIVIGLVTGTEALRGRLLEQHPAGSRLVPCASSLVKAECLVNVFRRNDQVLAERYLEYFESLDMLGISDKACVLASRIRARTRLKLPDALHLAIAEIGACSLFWTVDRDFEGIEFPLRIEIKVTPFGDDKGLQA